MSPACPPARRRKAPSAGLMGRTALSGAIGAFAALGFGAGSQAGPQGGLQGPVAAPGVTNAPGVSTSGTTTDVTLKQSRTIIDWSSFQLDKGETLNFLFGAKNWIVLNRTPGTAVVDGALNGCVVTCGTVGGNVWIYGAEGVIFGPNARVNVGSLLATTAPLASELDFLSGKTGGLTFTGGQDFAAVRVQAGAEIAAHGGALALVAPQVETEAGSTVSATGVATIAAAKGVTVHFDASAGGNLDLIDFQLPASALEDGTVSATPLAVNGAVSGGSVVLAAVSRPSVMNALISVGGTVTATGAQAGEGGSIVLTGSGGAAKADVSGALVAHGGKVDVSATDVALEGTIDVSGVNDGGTVRLGGGARGQDPTIANAQTVTVSAGAVIDADATGAKGDGGSVTVWSDKATDFQGAITARGGASGGDGGSAEVSGGWLSETGVVDLRAPFGSTGTLLLDPDNLQIIATGAGTGTFNTTALATDPQTNAPGAETPPGPATTFSVSDINGKLGSANVTLSTSDNGAISFVDSATYTFTGSGKLTFNATGAGSVVLSGAATAIQANNTGGLELDSGGAFSLGGHTVAVGAAGAPLIVKASSITVDGTLTTTATGALTLTATGAGATDGVASTAAGTITAHVLNASAAGAAGIDLRLGAVGVDQLGAITTTGTDGGFAVKDTRALALTGAVALNGAGVLNLATTTGAISQNAGAGVSIAAGSVTGQAPGGFSLNNGLNTFTGVGAITTTGAAADIVLVSAGALTVSGALSAGRDAAITGAGLTITGTGAVAATRNLNLTAGGLASDLVIGGAVSANATTGTATLSAGRHTTESFAGPPAATGTITAGTLSISTGDATLDGANAVAKISALNATGDVSFTDGQALEFAPGFPVLTPLAGNLTLKTTAGGLTLDTLVATGSSLDLETAGALSTQGIAVGGDYLVKAASFTTPAATLAPTLGLASAFSIEQTAGDLALSSIGTPTAAGAFTVKVDAGNVTAGANLQGSSVSVTGKAVTVDKLTATTGNITVTATNGALTLQDTTSTGGATDGHAIALKSTGGGISQTGGTMVTQTLDVQGDGVVSLGQANTVGALTHLTSNGALTFRDNVSALTISTANTGATGGLVSLRNSGSLTVTGLSVGTAGASLTSDTAAVEVTDALTLGGGSTSVTAATIASFDGAVTGPGSMTVHAPTTVFGSTVGASTALGGLTVDHAATLDGNISVGAVGLTISGVATLDQDTTLTSGGAVSLAGATSDTAATPRALTVSATGAFGSTAALGSANTLSSLAVTATSASFAGVNKTDALSVDLSSGASAVATSFSFTNSATLLTLGAIKTNDGDATVSTDGALKVNAAVGIGSGAATLTAGGDLTQGSAGAITAAALDATSDGQLRLDTVASSVDQLTLSNGGSALATAFLNTKAVTASGFTQVGGSLAITTQTGLIDTGAITVGTALANGAPLTLTAGSVTPAGATITTGALTAAGSAGSITLKAGSTISAGGENVGGSYSIEATNTGGNAFLGSTLAPTFTGTAATVHGFSITRHGGGFDLTTITPKTITGAFAITADGAVTGTGLTGASIDITGGSINVGSLTTTGVGGALQLTATAGALQAGDLTSEHGDAVLTTNAGAITLTGTDLIGTRADGATPADDRTLQLRATGGAITQTGGFVNAARLDAIGDHGVTLGQDNAVDQIVQLKDTAAAGPGAGATFVDGTATAVDVLAVSSAHGNVAISAGDITLDGPVSAALAGVPAANQSVTLTAASGGVRQAAGGVVTADALTVAATNGIDLESAGVVNAVATSVSLSAGTGAASFLNATATGVPLQVAGATAGQAVEIVNPNGIRLTGAVVAVDPGTFARRAVTLKAATGAVTQTAAGTIDAGSLTLVAQGAITLDQANSFDTVAGATTGGAITLDSSTLTAVGGVSGAGVSVTGGAGNLTISGIDGGTGNVSVVADGAITLAAAGAPTPATVITAGPVTGSQRVTLTSNDGAVTQAAGSTIQAAELAVSGTRIGLGEANHVRTAVSLAGRDGVVFSADETDATGLQVLSATETSLAAGGGAGIALSNTGDLILGERGAPAVPGVISAGSDEAVTLASSAGQVFQAGGSLAAGSLTAVGLHGVLLTAGTNTVATVTRLSDTGTGAADGGDGVSYAGVGPVEVLRADSQAGNVTLASTRDLTLGGPVAALGHAAGKDIVSLTAGSPAGGTVGSVLGSGGAVTADVVTGGAAEDFTLDNPANAIGRLQDVTVGFTSPATVDHSLTVVDATGLTLGGAIGGARTTITLTAGGAVLQDATADAALTGAQLSVSASGGLTLQGNNAVARVQTLTNVGAGGVTYTFGPGALTVHDVSTGTGAGAGGLTLHPFDLAAAGGDLTLDGALAVGAQTADIEAKGSVTQTAGSLTAGTLTGSATTGFTLAPTGDAFGRLGALTVTAGGATLYDASALVIAGPVAVHGPSGTPSTLSITAATLDVQPVAAPATTIDADNAVLTATGTPASPADAISISGSIRTASGLTDLEAAHGPVEEHGAGSITAKSLKVAASGGVALTDLGDGSNGATQIVSISNAGSGAVTLTLPAAATFTGAVTNLGGAVTITGADALTFDAAVRAGGPLTLTATAALTGTDATADTGALQLTGVGVTFSGAAKAVAGLAMVDAKTGAADFGTLSATDTVTVTAGGGASFGALEGGADVSVMAGGVIGVTTTFDVGGSLILSGSGFTGVALTPHFTPIPGATSGQDFTLTDTSGGLSYASLHAPGDLTVTADGTGATAPIAGGALSSDHGHIAVSGTSLAITGAVTATGAPADATPAIALTARTGDIGLSGLVNAGARTAALSAAGAVGETGNGAINAATLTVQSGAAITLNGPNGQGLSAMTATLANSGAGGVSFTDGAGVVTLTSVTTGSGDIALAGPTATTFTLPATLTSPGAITVDVPGGELDGGAVAAQGGALSLTGLRVTLTGAAQASAGLSVDGEGDVVSLQTLTANGGGILVKGGDIATGDATASGGITYHGTGAVTAGVLMANGGPLALTGGSLTFASAGVTGDAMLTSAGDTTFTGLTASSAATITAGGALQATQVTATAGNATLQAASVQLDTVSAGVDLSAMTTAGDLNVATSASAGRDATLASAGALDVSAITVGRNVAASAATLTTIGGLTTGAAGDVAISGQDVALGAAAGTAPAATNALVTGADTTLEVDATRDLGLNLTGPLAATRLTAGRNLTLAVTGGDATADILSAGGALSETVTGGSATIGTLTLTSAGPATIDADQDVVLGQGFAGATLSIPGDLLVLNAGRDVTIAYPGAVSLAQATAGRALSVTAGGLLSADTLTATAGAATLQAASLDVGTLSAGAAIDATTTTGALTLGQATAATDVTLISAGTLQATTLTAGQDLALTAAGALTGGALTATTGSATLTAASMEVQALSAATDANATTTGAGQALILHQASVGDTLSATSAGALQGDTLTAGGALTLTAAGALTGGTLTATGGTATLQGATLDVTTLTAGTDIAASATAGDLTLSQATAAGNLQATATGALTGTTLTATAGTATLNAASVDVQTLAAGTDVAVTTTAGPLTLGQATAGRDLAATAAGALQADTLTAGRDITLAAAPAGSAAPRGPAAAASPSGAPAPNPGDIVLGTALAGRDLSATATGALTADALTATTGTLTLDAATIAATTLTAGADATLASTGGDVVLGAATTGGDFTADSAGAFSLQTLVAGGSAAVQAAGAATLDAATVGGDLSLASANADAALRTVTMTAAQHGALTLTVTAAGEASIGAAIDGGPAGALTLADPARTQVRVESLGAGGGTARVDVTGDATLTQVSSASGDVLVRSGGAIVGTAVGGAPLFQAAGALNATSAGDMTLSGVSSSGGAATLQSGGALTLDTLNAGTSAALTSVGPMQATSVTAGTNATLASSATLSATTLTTGGAATLSSQDAMTVGTLKSGGAATLTSQDALDATSVTAGAAAILDAQAGLTVGALNAGTDATLTSGGATSVSALAAQGVASLTSGGAMQVQTLTSGGDAILASQDALTGGTFSVGGAATLTSQAALSLGGLTATGAVTLTSTAGTLEVGTLSAGAATTLKAQNALTVDTSLASGGDAAVQSVAGDVTLGAGSVTGAATLYAHGVLRFQQAFTATTEVDAVAADLDIPVTGSLDAPVIRIASRTGSLVVGGAASAATADGPMTIDADEFSRLNPGGGRATNAVTLYAGNPFGDVTLTDAARSKVLVNADAGGVAEAAPQGDLTVGDLTIDPAKVKTLTLLAGNAATVTVTGRVAPSADTTGAGGVDLVIGQGPGSATEPRAKPVWTPQDILVEGGLGGPQLQGAGGTQHYSLTTPIFALHSVELNATDQVLIGGATLLEPTKESSFAGKLQAAIVNLHGGNPISVINVTRGTPAGIGPDFGDFNRNIVTTGTLTVRTDGYLVQQNTGSTGQQGGVFLTNPDKTATVLTLGRITGVGAAGALVPDLIDVSINFVSSSGTLITRQVAATSLGIDASDISRSDAYRINGCTIGVAGTCTPLPNTISNIHIDKLVEGVQIASEDPPAIDDPTITGAGNEEIWRAPSPACSPTTGRVCK